MYHIDNPIERACGGYADSSPARFHMPGHKGRSDFSSPDISLDLTELPYTGSAMEPGDEIFSSAYAEASKLYGSSATIYSASGATLALQAAIFIAGKRKPVFACFRSIHRSAVNAMALLGIDPVWISSPEMIPENSAVLVTSPDYYGRMADIKALSETAHSKNALLVVDGAHGAHLAFYRGGIYHPLRLGADLAAESLHKTLPALTGAALLHAKPSDITADECLGATRLFGSTSPSYLINLSSERCLYIMSRSGEELLSNLLRRITGAVTDLESLGYEFLSSGQRDPFRIVFRMKNARSFASGLARMGIICEFADNEHIVLIPSPNSSSADFDRLYKACAALSGFNIKCEAPEKDTVYDIPPPPKAMSLREAVLAAHETVPASQAAGRICGEAATPYPPGIPAVMPGEIITKDAADILREGGCVCLNVVR